MKEDAKSKKQYRKIQKKKRRNYKFSDKTHPVFGLLSFGFGLAAFLIIIITSFLSFRAKGEGGILIGLLGFGAMLLSVSGVVLSIIALRGKEIHYRFPVMGGVLCGCLTLFYFVLYILGAAA